MGRHSGTTEAGTERHYEIENIFCSHFPTILIDRKVADLMHTVTRVRNVCRNQLLTPVFIKYMEKRKRTKKLVAEITFNQTHVGQHMPMMNVFQFKLIN